MKIKWRKSGENSDFSKTLKHLWGRRDCEYLWEKKITDIKQRDKMKSRKYSSKGKCGRKINFKR